MNGETVPGMFKLDKNQKIYGHSLTASQLLQAEPLQLKGIFTPNDQKRYTTAECTVGVNVIPRRFVKPSYNRVLNKMCIRDRYRTVHRPIPKRYQNVPTDEHQAG